MHKSIWIYGALALIFRASTALGQVIPPSPYSEGGASTGGRGSAAPGGGSYGDGFGGYPGASVSADSSGYPSGYLSVDPINNPYTGGLRADEAPNSDEQPGLPSGGKGQNMGSTAGIGDASQDLGQSLAAGDSTSTRAKAILGRLRSHAVR